MGEVLEKGGYQHCQGHSSRALEEQGNLAYFLQVNHRRGFQQLGQQNQALVGQGSWGDGPCTGLDPLQEPFKGQTLVGSLKAQGYQQGQVNGLVWFTVQDFQDKL